MTLLYNEIGITVHSMWKFGRQALVVACICFSCKPVGLDRYNQSDFDCYLTASALLCLPYVFSGENIKCTMNTTV